MWSSSRRRMRCIRTIRCWRLRHGKAVLCEKPLAMNAAEAEEMDCGRARLLDCCLVWRRTFAINRSLEWMREQIAAGRIGKPQLAHAQYCYPAAQAPRKWITDPTLACGGPIADVGVHCIDALRFVLGEDVRSVSTLARKDEVSGQGRGGRFAAAGDDGRSLCECDGECACTVSHAG